jgi:endonuclease/exonuclease/phosphatase family metal-dependent hydrolase
MSRILLFLLAVLPAIVGACGGTVQPAQGPPPSLRVMTFNIRYGTAQDGENAWPLRRPLTIRVIRDFRPAVLGLQEALRFQLDEIRRELPQYGEVGAGRDDGRERGEYSAILFDSGGLAVVDSGTFWLSDTPATPGSMTWGNRFPRVVTWARFRHRNSGRTFYVYNTHWDHESQPSRERAARLTLERIAARPAPDDPVILMGDFNAGEDNPAFRSLLQARGSPAGIRFIDAFRALHPDARDTGTYHAFTGDRTGDRIDAILATPDWRPLEAEIVLLSESGRYPSDHFPVTATLLLRARAPPP